jgi:hypothetical protein
MMRRTAQEEYRRQGTEDRSKKQEARSKKEEARSKKKPEDDPPLHRDLSWILTIVRGPFWLLTSDHRQHPSLIP